jgi:hypothetical protein
VALPAAYAEWAQEQPGDVQAQSAAGQAQSANARQQPADARQLPADARQQPADVRHLPADAHAPATPLAAAAPAAAPAAAADDRFRILSPQAGDVYRVPAGVEARYATIALRAAGGASGRGLHWYVDGRSHPAARWALAPGRHRIGAVDAAGDSAEVSVTVE